MQPKKMKQQTFPTLVIEYGRLLVVFTWPFKKAFLPWQMLSALRFTPIKFYFACKIQVNTIPKFHFVMYIKTSSTLTSWVLVLWVLWFPASLILQVYTAIQSLKKEKRNHNWMSINEKILLASMYNCTPNNCWKKLL